MIIKRWSGTAWEELSPKITLDSITATGRTSTNFLRGDGTWSIPLNYYPNSFSWTNGTTAGPTGSLTGTGTLVTFGAIPSASSNISGVVTTGTQTFNGEKTFNTRPKVGADSICLSKELPEIIRLI